MLNLYEAVRSDPSIKKLEIGDFLFAEYTCGIGVEKLGNWTDTDYLVHVISGRKTWHTADGVWLASPGDTLFFKKGATVVEQQFETDFCLLMFFVPDALIRSTVRELAGMLNTGTSHTVPAQRAARVENDVALAGFFQSMRAYFAGREKPSEPLLRLKLKELVVSILTGGRNPGLAAYFWEIAARDAPHVPEIMEANFRFNLSMEEYARLCHRSLSSFKREFQTHFKEPPRRWLLGRRLDYAAALLRGSTLNVTDVSLESGFQDVSHFSRAFKQRFGASPVAFRRRA